MKNNHDRIDHINNCDGVQYKLVRVIDKTETDIHHIM